MNVETASYRVRSLRPKALADAEEGVVSKALMRWLSWGGGRMVCGSRDGGREGDGHVAARGDRVGADGVRCGREVAGGRLVGGHGAN